MQHMCGELSSQHQPECLISWGTVEEGVHQLLWPSFPILNISGHLELSFPCFTLPLHPSEKALKNSRVGVCNDGMGSSAFSFLCVLSDSSLPSLLAFLTPHICIVQAIKTRI